jgi:hypothetical protein
MIRTAISPRLAISNLVIRRWVIIEKLIAL